MPRRKKKPKRGYPIALLIGFDVKKAYIWQIFSERVKLYNELKLGNRKNKSKKQIFEFHEEIIDSLRLILKEGVKSILISNPIKTDYAELFLEHVKKHHQWLVQQKAPSAASFGMIIGLASELEEVKELLKDEKILKKINETLDKEADKIMNVLEKRLNQDVDGKYLIFSLKDIEKTILKRWEPEDLKPEYLILTDKYLKNSKQKNRLNRLIQIAKNKKIKVKIVSEEETNAGKRVAEFGGIVCFTEINS